MSLCIQRQCSYRRKREVASSTVDKGVNERMRLTQIYDKRKEELDKQHLEVRQSVEEERAKVRSNVLVRNYNRFVNNCKIHQYASFRFHLTIRYQRNSKKKVNKNHLMKSSLKKTLEALLVLILRYSSIEKKL